MACTVDQLSKLSELELNLKLGKARDILVDSGAHYVIDSVADLPDVILDINKKLSIGEKP